jgi:hypothetical protein
VGQLVRERGQVSRTIVGQEDVIAQGNRPPAAQPEDQIAHGAGGPVQANPVDVHSVGEVPESSPLFRRKASHFPRNSPIGANDSM